MNLQGLSWSFWMVHIEPRLVAYLPYDELAARDRDDYVAALRLRERLDRKAALEERERRGRLAKRLRELRKIARKQGYEAGRRAAREELTAETLALAAAYSGTVERAYDDCLDLALSIVRRLLGEESVARLAIGERIMSALRLLPECGAVRVEIPEEDVGGVRSLLREKGVAIRIDGRRLDPGTARLVTTSGGVVLRLDRDLDAFAQSLKRLLRERCEEEAVYGAPICDR